MSSFDQPLQQREFLNNDPLLSADLNPGSGSQPDFRRSNKQLDRWQLPVDKILELFPDFADTIVLRDRTTVNPENRKIAFLSWENPFGKAGGVYPVAVELVEGLKGNGESVIRISPFHSGIAGFPVQVKALREEGQQIKVERGTTGTFDLFELVAKVQVPFKLQPLNMPNEVPCTVIKLTTAEGREWYLLKAPSFFKADGGANKNDPYFYSSAGQHPGDPGLVRDALFASAAVPYVLKALAGTKDSTGKSLDTDRDVILHAQDWQFSAVALTTLEALRVGVLQSAATCMTLHNVYDEGLGQDPLFGVTLRTNDRLWTGLSPRDPTRGTFLARFLPLFLGPISAVSYKFALDIRNDPQQSHNLAPHLQSIFRKTEVIGVGHGPFVDTSKFVLDNGAVEAARQGDLLGLWRQKMGFRAELVETVRRIPPEKRRGNLDLYGLDMLHDDCDVSLEKGGGGDPILLVGGRLEPNQKGFDIVAQAIRMLGNSKARFIFSPMNSDEKNQPFMDLLFSLTEEFPGRVVVLPEGLPRDEWMRLQRGASFVVFWSMFEPFGAVTEGYVNGTPILARETGGLTSQVKCLQKATRTGIDDFIRASTGLLGIENWTADDAKTAAEWKIIHGARDPEERMKSDLYRRMCSSAHESIIKACEVYQYPRKYTQLLVGVADYVRGLSWDESAFLYKRMYEIAGTSFKEATDFMFIEPRE